jgi:DNA-binding beta-propeller fold protein YncE
MAGLSATGLLTACGESSPAEAVAAPATTASTTAAPAADESSSARHDGDTVVSAEAKKADAAKAANIAASTGIGTDGDAGELFLLSNESPHITTIDILTEEIARTADLEGFTSWAWNDDNNFFDGAHLWLGTLDPTAGTAELITLDVATLKIARRIPLGDETKGLFFGKPTQDGSLLASKMGAGEIAVVDTATGTVRTTFTDLDLNGGELSDGDLSTGPDGVERFVYPTGTGDSIVTLDPQTGTTLGTAETKKGATPTRVTTSPADGSIWVQQPGSDTHAVYDPATLKRLKRFDTGKTPTLGSLTIDGAYAYTAHADAGFIQVIDTEKQLLLAHIRVGKGPRMIAARPDFTRIYAMVADDQQVDVIYQQDWATNHLTITSTVENSIPLPSAPVGLFLRMTSIGLRSRDSAKRSACPGSMSSGRFPDLYLACNQNFSIGKKR